MAKPIRLLDGGIFMNNPALGAYSEVRNAAGNPKTEDLFILSLGTGSSDRPYPYDKARNWGAVGWIKPVIDILMSGASATTHYHLKKIFSAEGRLKQYVRVQPKDMGTASAKIDDASPENLRALVALGLETARQYEEELNRVAAVLLEADPDPLHFS